MRIWGVMSLEGKSHSLGEATLGHRAGIFLFPTHYTRLLEVLGFTQRARRLLLGTQGLAPVDPPAGFYSSSPQRWGHFQPPCLHVSLDASSILFTSLTWSSFFLFDGNLGCLPGFILWLSKINFVTFLSSSSMPLRWEDEFPMSAQSTKLTSSPSEHNI